MGTISLRLPESLHRQVRELAKSEEVSINQLITAALAEKMSALMTVDHLEGRAARGDRSKSDRAMRKVRDVEPDVEYVARHSADAVTAALDAIHAREDSALDEFGKATTKRMLERSST